MTVTINGTTGIDKVQDGSIQAADLAYGVPSTSQLPAGTVLQVVSQNLTSSGSASGGSWQTIFSASITPTSTNSKILVIAMGNFSWSSGGEVEFGTRIIRNGSVVLQGDALGSATRCMTWNTLWNSPYKGQSIQITFLDSPSTTSATTYALQGYGSENQAFYYNRTSDTGGEYDGASVSTITLMEIAA